MNKSLRSGFTIVELLIVVVVIAILATITLVSYNGITARAQQSAAQSQLANLSKRLKVEQAQTGAYPASLASLSGIGSLDNVLYFVSPIDSLGGSYCVQVTNGSYTAYITQDSIPTTGTCGPTGLVGWWKLNGTSVDSSSSAFPTTVSGSPTVNATGQNGQASGAYLFNGASYVTTANISSLGSSVPQLSLSGWVYVPSTQAGHQGYFGIRDNIYFYVLQLGGTSNLECRMRTNQSATLYTAGTVAVTNATWNFIVMVYTGNSVQCFVNGVGGTATTTPAGTIAMDTASGFYIGTSGRDSGFPTSTTRIDDVRIYNHALTPAEISSLYAAGAQ